MGHRCAFAMSVSASPPRIAIHATSKMSPFGTVDRLRPIVIDGIAPCRYVDRCK